MLRRNHATAEGSGELSLEHQAYLSDNDFQSRILCRGTIDLPSATDKFAAKVDKLDYRRCETDRSKRIHIGLHCSPIFLNVIIKRRENIVNSGLVGASINSNTERWYLQVLVGQGCNGLCMLAPLFSLLRQAALKLYTVVPCCSAFCCSKRHTNAFFRHG